MEERAFLMANRTGQLKPGLAERQSGDESGRDLGVTQSDGFFRSATIGYRCCQANPGIEKGIPRNPRVTAATWEEQSSG